MCVCLWVCVSLYACVCSQLLCFLAFVCFVASTAASFVTAPLLEFLTALFLLFAYSTKLNQRFTSFHWPLMVSPLTVVGPSRPLGGNPDPRNLEGECLLVLKSSVSKGIQSLSHDHVSFIC